MSESKDDPGFDKEGLKNVLFVAIAICLVCSVVMVVLGTLQIFENGAKLINGEADAEKLTKVVSLGVIEIIAAPGQSGARSETEHPPGRRHAAERCAGGCGWPHRR